jgi:hypothetical protein
MLTARVSRQPSGRPRTAVSEPLRRCAATASVLRAHELHCEERTALTDRPMLTARVSRQPSGRPRTAVSEVINGTHGRPPGTVSFSLPGLPPF